MARYMPDRDDRGRFMSDDDYDHRDRGYGRYERDRDDQGRFVSDDDHRRGYSRAERRDDDDRDDRGRRYR